jgi:GNAT superfamily N-acetyltransferase
MDDQGYIEMFCDPLMICEGPLDLPPLNPTVTITQVQSRADQAIYSQVIVKGFDLVGSGQEFIDFMLSIATSYHVLAWVDGQAVGAGSVIYSGGVAGVYNVATLPWARRRGVAVTVMNALHTNALHTGYSGTALASSAMGLSLYKRLGYRLDGYQMAYMPGGL